MRDVCKPCERMLAIVGLTSAREKRAEATMIRRLQNRSATGTAAEPREPGDIT